MIEHPDHFKQASGGYHYAGDHLLVEFWDAHNLADADVIRNTMETSARTAGATVLHSHYHKFGDGGGISGVTILAESHITIHTWPERGYAAIDIFMCGDCNPNDCLPVLEHTFRPGRSETQSVERGCEPRVEAVKEVA